MDLKQAEGAAKKAGMAVVLENGNFIFYRQKIRRSEQRSFKITYSIVSGIYTITIFCRSIKQATQVAKAMHGTEVYAKEHLFGTPVVTAL
jgi:ribose 5-phosphate isomerase